VSSSPAHVVRDLYAAFAARDLPTIFRLFSPDIEIVQSEELPWGGIYRGHPGAQQFFGKLLTHLNSTLEIERFIASGDHVTAIGWTQGTVNGTGARYRVPIAHVWKVAGGQLVRAHFLIDHPTMLEALRAGGAEG
jgi:ketosteroid isomerase-like protein